VRNFFGLLDISSNTSASSQNRSVVVVFSLTEYSSSLALGAWPWLNFIIMYDCAMLYHGSVQVYMVLNLIGQNDNLREVEYEPYPTFALWDVKYGSYSLPVS